MAKSLKSRYTFRIMGLEVKVKVIIWKNKKGC